MARVENLKLIDMTIAQRISLRHFSQNYSEAEGDPGSQTEPGPPSVYLGFRKILKPALSIGPPKKHQQIGSGPPAIRLVEECVPNGLGK